MASESTSYYPAVSFYFSVDFDGAEYAFKEVSGLEVELEVEEIKGGGNNLYNHRVPSRTKYNNLILKRGAVPNGSRLHSWIENSIQYNTMGVVDPKNIWVSLLDEATGTPTTTWVIINAYPIKWKYADLNAEESSILMETIEFAYERFMVIS